MRSKISKHIQFHGDRNNALKKKQIDSSFEHALQWNFFVWTFFLLREIFMFAISMAVPMFNSYIVVFPVNLKQKNFHWLKHRWQINSSYAWFSAGSSFSFIRLFFPIFLKFWKDFRFFLFISSRSEVRGSSESLRIPYFLQFFVVVQLFWHMKSATILIINLS